MGLRDKFFELRTGRDFSIPRDFREGKIMYEGSYGRMILKCAKVLSVGLDLCHFNNKPIHRYFHCVQLLPFYGALTV